MPDSASPPSADAPASAPVPRSEDDGPGAEGPADGEAGLGEGQDATLGGYLEVHDRPPAFEGPDGHPYTVSPEVEKTGDLAAPYHAYLVFPRWAATGVGIVGHVESPTLFRERSTREAADALAALSLVEVQQILDRAVEAAGPNPSSLPND